MVIRVHTFKKGNKTVGISLLSYTFWYLNNPFKSANMI